MLKFVLSTETRELAKKHVLTHMQNYANNSNTTINNAIIKLVGDLKTNHPHLNQYNICFEFINNGNIERDYSKQYEALQDVFKHLNNNDNRQDIHNIYCLIFTPALKDLYKLASNKGV